MGFPILLLLFLFGDYYAYPSYSAVNHVSLHLESNETQTIQFPIPATIVLLDIPLDEVFVSFFGSNGNDSLVHFASASPGSITAGAFFGPADGAMEIWAKSRTSVSFFVLPPRELCSRIYLYTDPYLHLRVGSENLTDLPNTRTCFWHFHPAPKQLLSSIRSFLPGDSLTLYAELATGISFESGNISRTAEWTHFFVYQTTGSQPTRAVNISIRTLQSIPFPLIRAEFAFDATPAAIPLARGFRHYKEEHAKAEAQKGALLFCAQLGLAGMALALGFGCRILTKRQHRVIEKDAMKALKARLQEIDEFSGSFEGESGNLRGVERFDSV
jgi:hypothetical protein